MKTKQLTPNTTSGFALIIALSLMAFVLLLLLSVTTLVKVETSSAELSQKQLIARQNAILGAMVALGDIQKLTGPDQRVTARADILDPNVRDVTVTGNGYDYWTGVWSSKLNTGGNPTNDTNDFAVGLENHKPQWLVSGDISAYVNNTTNKLTTQITSGTDTVVLATLGKSVEQIGQQVVVPKESITGSGDAEVGEYAFWVSDDGVKARVNSSDVHSPSNPNAALDSEYYHMALAQQADASAVRNTSGDRPYEVGGESIWKSDFDSPSKIYTPSDIPMLLPSGVGSDTEILEREFFHDFTAYSNSLITNTRSGGLKRDLSTILRQTALPTDLNDQLIFPTSTGNYNYRQTDSGSPSGGDGVSEYGDPGGPAWAQLADHYTYSLKNSGMDVNDSISLRAHTNKQVSIAPIITRFNLIYQGVATGADTDEATDYAVRLGIFPLITLWNPYDREIEFDDLGLYINHSGMTLAHEDHVEKDGGSTYKPTTNLGTLFQNWKNAKRTPDQIDDKRYFVGFNIRGGTIGPGEAINFAPPNNSLLSIEADQNVLHPGGEGDLVRGFFSAPITPSGITPPLEMFDNFGLNAVDRKCKLRLYVKNLAHHHVALSTNPTVNERDGRISYFSTDGIAMATVLPRVISIHQLDPSGALTVEGVGSSRDAPSTAPATPFDIAEMQALTHDNSVSIIPGTMAGISMSMSFPRSNIRNERIHLLSQMNPRSPLHVNQKHLAGDYKYGLFDPGQEIENSSNRANNYSEGTDSDLAYVGLGNTYDADGSERMVLYEAPTRVPLNIGHLMHANLNNVYCLSSEVNPSEWNSNIQQLNTTPAYAIGNSFASIHMPLDETRMHIKEQQNEYYASSPNFKWDQTGSHYDYSYELNDALWDDFFFSTILPNNLSQPQADPSSIDFPLPNSRIKQWDEASGDADLIVEERAAGKLMVEGGFNINSTSVAAWESVLGALRDVETLQGSASDADTRHNYTRVAAPLIDSTGAIPDYWDDKDAISAGFRSLTDEQVSDLAEAIVGEIKTRRAGVGHPFLSLSEFVNRTLIDPDNVPSGQMLRFAYCGALQFAIDQSEVNGKPALDKNWNGSSDGKGLWENDYVTNDLPGSADLFHRESLEVIKKRPYLESAPGALSQADILSKIGAMITPRSDTFKIRSYGSSISALTGKPDSNAYFEMVVQRTPDYVDPTDQGYELPTNGTANEQFGRRFVILSSRWVAANEI